jgi:hypothetical protein
MKNNGTKTQFVNILVELAQEMEIKDSIDFGMLNIKEQDAFELMASTVVDQFESLPEEQRELVMLASLVKLLVENFVLNIRLNGVNT